MKRPVIYYQTDSRWRNNDYSATGETNTIGKAGCGPTSMAMVLATWKDDKITPAVTALWSKVHGYKVCNQGTAYSFFKAIGKIYGITASQLNASNLRGMTAAESAPYHAKALAAIQSGDLVVCCMGKGNWTKGGHFILWYGYEGGKVYINDPASAKAARTCAELALLQGEVKYYFVCKNPNTATTTAATTATTKEEKELTQEQFNTMMGVWLKQQSAQTPSAWSAQARTAVEAAGLITGDAEGNRQYKSFVTREQLAVILARLQSK